MVVIVVVVVVVAVVVEYKAGIADSSIAVESIVVVPYLLFYC